MRVTDAIQRTARAKILQAVREMAKEYPDADYTCARERFGLLGRIRSLCDNGWPTARECWQAAGLDRSHLVDEFEFTQLDIATKLAA